MTRAIGATPMPWALASTIWVRRQVTTDPVDRRTMPSSRLPSWLLTSRTRTRSATLAPLTPRGRRPKTRPPPMGRPGHSPLLLVGLPLRAPLTGSAALIRRSGTMVADHRGSEEDYETAITGRRFDEISG